MNGRPAPGTLFLLPCDLGEDLVRGPALPPSAVSVACRLTRFIVENPKSARAFLKRIGHPGPMGTLSMATLDKNTPSSGVAALLDPVADGADAALLSEAGCPAVADPGAGLVLAAHRKGIPVVPLVGPSAILLGLMASGLNGQRFAFHGYLPVAAADRARSIRELEQRSRRDDATQIFMETPYRNEQLVDALLENCAPATLLCIAADLTQPGEQVSTRSVAEWKKTRPAINRRPAVFLLSASRRER